MVSKQDLLIVLYFCIVGLQITSIVQIIEILLNVFQFVWILDTILIKSQEVFNTNPLILIEIVSIE